MPPPKLVVPKTFPMELVLFVATTKLVATRSLSRFAMTSQLAFAVRMVFMPKAVRSEKPVVGPITQLVLIPTRTSAVARPSLAHSIIPAIAITTFALHHPMHVELHVDLESYAAMTPHQDHRAIILGLTIVYLIRIGINCVLMEMKFVALYVMIPL